MRYRRRPDEPAIKYIVEDMPAPGMERTLAWEEPIGRGLPPFLQSSFQNALTALLDDGSRESALLRLAGMIGPDHKINGRHHEQCKQGTNRKSACDKPHWACSPSSRPEPWRPGLPNSGEEARP